MKRTIPITLLATALFLGACAKHESEEQVLTAVEVAAVSETPGGADVRYSATVEPDAQVAVAFRVSGYVEDVAVEEGDRVSKGTVLARVRSSDYAEKLGQASASQHEAQAALAQAKNDLARAQTLFAANALTKPELDAAIANVDVNQARVNRGRAAAGEAGLALRDTALVAPIDGVILRRNIERGDLGAPGATAFVLANTRTVKVMFGAPDTMISALKTGQSIEVTTESMADKGFDGKIARIAPAADPKTRSFDVEIHIDNASNELKPGMVASLQIARGSAPLLAVPLDAVVRPAKSKEGYAVYVVNSGKVQMRNVDLGEPMGNLVALHGGLGKGEQIVVSGPALLVDGQAVRVLNGGAHAQQ
ncbi:MAG TPA: efflux RND transporter periplasmic adaptor subunit [Thermoanaerobaculia bacterium]|jgi:multidrug efflux system membrane fusion protein|nr:efflux RND transporter periplasmic adaptor subunit [Thermoanaerobaculia bacterium]